MRILGLSGSLGKASASTRLLKASAKVAPGNVTIVAYEGLGSLPHFNPDLDREPSPPAVAEFRSELNCSAGVVISIMEYVNGVPGVLKNALDWLVGSGELYEKPVALFNAAQRGTYARQSLLETLTVMTARIIPEACAIVPVPARSVDKSALVAGSKISKSLRSALRNFTNAILSGKNSRQ